MKDLQKEMHYQFKNEKLLETALTHSSYANEIRRGVQYNERLEFLGDAVLCIVVSDYLFSRCPDVPEGGLTRLRASLVCEKTLCRFSRQMDVGQYLRLGKGECNSGGRERPSILADAFEAILAAVYLDGGMEEARKFVERFVEQEFKVSQSGTFKDYKTTLQEIVQQNPEERLEYKLISETGPDHDKHFLCEVHLNNNPIGRGGGRSKKNAEQQAAREALELMGY